MLLRVSACGGLFWREGGLIWDDYLEHRQFGLAAGVEQLLSRFADWFPTGSIAVRADQDAARTLAEHGILVERGSRRHQREETILASWSDWGPIARAFHYATRTDATTRFLDPVRQDLTFARKRGLPPITGRATGAREVSLPAGGADLWRHRDLLEVLERRRSQRRFPDVPMSLAQLSALLDLTARARRVDPVTATMFRTSPSGGGRHPTELYVCARAVSGLEPGLYHYRTDEHTLERLGDRPADDELVRACGDQSWASEGAVLLFYTSVLARNSFKYENPRSYRVLQLDAGHLNQTLSLVATALGLGTTFTAAVWDECIEGFLNLDPAAELVLGCAVLGHHEESG